MMSTPKKQRIKASLKPLTRRQLEVLESCHYGEVFLEFKAPGTKYGIAWARWVRDGVDCTSVVRILAKTKRLRFNRDTSVHAYPEQTYRFITLTPRGIEELESHPAPWKE